MYRYLKLTFDAALVFDSGFSSRFGCFTPRTSGFRVDLVYSFVVVGT